MTERWSLAAGYVPSTLVALVLGAVVVVGLFEAWLAFRRTRGRMTPILALGLLALRLTALAAILGLAFELTLRVESVSPSGRRVVVLVDNSASMAIADAPTLGETPERRQARIERVWRESDTARTSWREQGLAVEVIGFEQETHAYTGELAETLAKEPRGHGSALARAFTEIGEAESENDRPLAAVVVLSDGLVAQDEAEDGHLGMMAASLGVPVTTVSAGAPALRDVSVAEVRAGEFAFVENMTEFEATIVAHGLAGTQTRVELVRNGEVVAKHPIQLPGDGVPRVVRFEVAPDRVGQFVYEIAVPVQEGEATLRNNRRAFVLKVLRDKVRVLHVAGRPDWDVRALRTLLRRDPNVELLSYYILRDWEDINREDSSAPLSLIPFPTEELFEQELGSFDLIILHNFDAVKHQVGRYLPNIAEYVERGGALVLIGGDLGLAEGGYAGEELSPLLPIDAGHMAGLRGPPFRPALTDGGRRHPITAWLAAAPSGEAWGELPELEAYNPLTLTSDRARIGATALLVHPDAKDGQGEPRPILAVAEPGHGRTMALATGSTWRLGFAPNLALIDGSRPYDLLWLGAVRWLLRDESSGRLSLETDKPRYREGEEVELRATTLTPSYAPEPDVEVNLRVHPLTSEHLSEQTSVAKGVLTTDALGRGVHQLEHLPVGAYAAVATRLLDGEGNQSSEHEARRVFLIQPPGHELAHIDADPGIPRLAKVADATGGEALSAVAGDLLPHELPLGDPFAERSSAARVRIDSRKDIPLWDGWIALVVLIAAFGTEWILRRRHGQR